MAEITRTGPRFTILIGFDLGQPLFEIGKYSEQSHWRVVLGWLEIHLLWGKARDLQLDLFEAGAKALFGSD